MVNDGRVKTIVPDRTVIRKREKEMLHVKCKHLFFYAGNEGQPGV